LEVVISFFLFLIFHLNFFFYLIHFADYDESQEPFIGGGGSEANNDGHFYKSMVAAIVVAVVVSVVLVVLVGFYLKRNITYKAIISGRANRGEMAHSSKVGFQLILFVLTLKTKCWNCLVKKRLPAN
jgi:hypothetical protein